MMHFSEDSFEQAIVSLFENLGYEYQYGPDIERDYYTPFYEEELKNSLIRINPLANRDIIETAINQLKNISSGSLEDRNFQFNEYMQNGLPVSYVEDNEDRTFMVKLIDFDNIEKNDFKVINQWTFIEYSNKRPDVVVFINGLPLVVIELKSPTREDVDIGHAYRQIKNYMKEIPSLFVYNAFCVISDMNVSKAGTITSNENRFMEWKTTDGNYENTKYANYDVLFEGMFEKNRFLDILKNFILYSIDTDKYIKILGAYHQYFAVKKAVKTTLKAVEGDGKAGVFWHTQGSGKSLSMVFYVNKLQQVMDNPTFVVLTDRNDLDNQLFSQFSKCSNFLRQIPKQAESRQNLKELLENRIANGIFFSTMQKFEESSESLTDRRDIIVISDEAHRSQYGFDEKVNSKTGKISIGAARRVRDNLPNATFIGFTGTPISTEDKSTLAVFGNYIDIYDITQSVEDGATCEIHYESRVIKLELDDEILEKIDEKYDELSLEAEPYAIEKSKQKLSQMEELLSSKETLDSLCSDLITHYENNRMNELKGKAMIVAYSRRIAMKIYDKILKLRPQWSEKVKVVMTSSNNDPEEWHDIIRNNSYKQTLAAKFKDAEDEFKIAIVVDMWLTGFDVPSLDTMYIFKPMKDHTLMQAISRVNRVYEGKNGGLIVDYIGIGAALRKAISNYTKRDQGRYGDINIINVAYPHFQEVLEKCQILFYEYDYSDFYSDNAGKRAKSMTGGLNFILSVENEENKKYFLEESLKLKKWFSLCKSIATKKERFEAAYFESIRSMILKVTKKGSLSVSDINEQISKLLEQSIKSKGVINLFSDVKEETSLFDDKFIARLKAMDEENLAIQLLQKLLKDEIKGKKYKQNIVKSEKFSAKLTKIMNSYINGHITNQQVIDELILLAKEIREDNDNTNKLGLTNEELAFYDALSKPENIHDFYENEELIEITKELTNKLNENMTIDWQKKESARAGMRRIVKRLLKKHKYPPECMNYAMDIVLRQCEQWADISEI